MKLALANFLSTLRGQSSEQVRDTSTRPAMMALPSHLLSQVSGGDTGGTDGPHPTWGASVTSTQTA